LNSEILANKLRCLAIVIGLLLYAGSPAGVQAQLPKPALHPPSAAKPAGPVDPLGRETPRDAVMGLLKSLTRRDYTTAARYIQPPDDKSINVVQLIEKLRPLRGTFKGDIALLSNDPHGDIEPGLPEDEVRVGRLQVGNSASDLILVRVDDPEAGKIWLVSKDSLLNAARLAQAVKTKPPSLVARVLPRAVTETEELGMSLATWLGWLLSLPLSLLLAWPIGFLLTAPAWLVYKIRKLPFKSVWQTSFGKPLRYILAILINYVFIYLLQSPLFYRVYYMRMMAALLAACLVWLLARVIDHGFQRALARARARLTGTESILILTHRFVRILLVLIAVLAALSLLGFDTKTALAGLGIGGLAIALGAQKTFENVLGGVSLLMDKVAHLGNVCKIGDQSGTIEDIGLRSVKLRTSDQTVLVIPNGLLAQMKFENFASRRKCLISQRFSLRIETAVEQLRSVLDGIQTMLDQHPSIERGNPRIRVANFAGAAFELELWAFAETADWTQFTVIRQDVILKVAEIVAAAGTSLAAPTQLMYLSRDGIVTAKADDVTRQLTELGGRGANEVRLEPGSCPASQRHDT
jgi:MscS family membrane protein